MPQAAGREAPGQDLLTLFGLRLPEPVLRPACADSRCPARCVVIPACLQARM